MKTVKNILIGFFSSIGLAYSIICAYEGNLWCIIGIVVFYILITSLFTSIGINIGERYGKALGWFKRNIEIKIEEEAEKQQDNFEIYIKNELIDEYIEAFINKLYFGKVDSPYIIGSILNQGKESLVTFTKIKKI